MADQAVVCSRCFLNVERDLGDIPSHLTEVHITQARLAQTPPSERNGSKPTKGKSRPMPLDVRAYEALVALADTLGHYRGLLEAYPGSWDHTTSRIAQNALWLLARMEHMRHQSWAGQFADAIQRDVARIVSVIDIPPSEWFAGPCDHCHADLYVGENQYQVRCPGCRTVYDVNQRREWLRAAIDDTLATTTEISRALTTLATPVTVDSIRGYVRRGRLEAKGTDHRGNPTYRVGDVIDLVTAQARRRAS